MIKFVVRDNIDNGHIYGEPTGGWGLGIPFNRASSMYDTLEEALKKVQAIAEKSPSFADRLYVTETEYANERKLQQDFHITSNIRWSAWFDGYDKLRS